MRGRGLCRLEPRLVAFMDRRLPLPGRAGQLAAALSALDLSGVYLRPALHQFLRGYQPPDDSEDYKYLVKVSKNQQRLTELEKAIKRRGVRLGYERLEYAGLRLKSGMCWFRGDYYLFVDRCKAVLERLELLQNALEELDELAVQGRLDGPLLAEAQEVLEAGQPQKPGPADP
ncbi:hypothetical protein DFAR_340045 [Desulfarculales bacterium]